jgi:hypothetical protein
MQVSAGRRRDKGSDEECEGCIVEQRGEQLDAGIVDGVHNGVGS